MLRDDFGSYQFADQIVDVLKQARDKKIKHIEFNIVENRFGSDSPSQTAIYSDNSDAPDYTIINCSFNADSTLTMIKKYKNGTTCYKAGYIFVIINEIYCLKHTLSAFKNDVPSDSTCKILNLNYYYDEDWDSSFSGDTTMLTIIKTPKKRNPLDTDSVVIDSFNSVDTVAYCFDVNGRLLKIKRNRSPVTFKYSSGNSSPIKYIYNNKNEFSVTTVKKITSKKWISDNQYTYTEIIKWKNLTKMKKSKKSYRQSDKTKTILKYTLDKQNMPIEIKIIETDDYDSLKVTGSVMTIKYAI